MGISIAVAVAVGAAIGAAMHNVAMGVAFGAAFGVAAGRCLVSDVEDDRVYGGTNKVTILGAGTAIGNGGDDFEWMDTWQVYAKTRVASGGDVTNVPHFRGDALVVGMSEAASALIYWNGKRCVWLQQGD